MASGKGIGILMSDCCRPRRFLVEDIRQEANHGRTRSHGSPRRAVCLPRFPESVLRRAPVRPGRFSPVRCVSEAACAQLHAVQEADPVRAPEGRTANVRRGVRPEGQVFRSRARTITQGAGITRESNAARGTKAREAQARTKAPSRAHADGVVQRDVGIRRNP